MGKSDTEKQELPPPPPPPAKRVLTEDAPLIPRFDQGKKEEKANDN